MNYDLLGTVIGNILAISFILLIVLNFLLKYLKMRKKRKIFYGINPQVVKELKKKNKYIK